MTTNEPIQSTPASRFYEEAQQPMLYLVQRWMDESMYEDINDYQQVLEPIAERCGVKITGMTKRPFGCKFTYGGKVLHLSLTTRGIYRYMQTK